MSENEKIVSRCRRCGRKIEQWKRPKPGAISASANAYVLHSYCESCRRENRNNARGVDPRYAGDGGHGTVFPESPTINRKRSARTEACA